MSIRGLALVSAVLLASGAGRQARADGDIDFDARLTYRVEIAGAPSLGPDDAPVTVVEFSDFLCRYCQRASETLAELRLLYGDKLRIVYRHSLLDDEDGTLPAEAALAAGAQGRFWAFHDRLFAGDRPLDRAALDAYAGEIGLDVARFRRDLHDGRFRGALRDELEIAARLGVDSTPMFFINGRPVGGSQPIGVFTQVIDTELARAVAVRALGVAPAAVYDHLTRGGQTAASRLDDDAEDSQPATLDEAMTYPAGLGLPMQRRGAEDALVTVVEFGDFLCGYCGRVQPTLEALRDRYGADLRIVLRFFPLGGNAASELIAEAALAAGEQGRFWEFHDRVFAAATIDRRELERIAVELGLDRKKFGAALEERRFRRAVAVDVAEGSGFGVRGTPSFFINGRVLVGAQPRAAFEAAIETELVRARALVKAGVPRSEVYRRTTAAPR